MFCIPVQLFRIQIKDSVFIARVDKRFVIDPVRVAEVKTFLCQILQARTVAVDHEDAADGIVKVAESDLLSVGAELRRKDVEIKKIGIRN